LVNPFHVVSKLPTQTQTMFTAADQPLSDQLISESRDRFGLALVDLFLLHTPVELRMPGGLWLQEWLNGLREIVLDTRIVLSIDSA